MYRITNNVSTDIMKADAAAITIKAVWYGATTDTGDCAIISLCCKAITLLVGDDSDSPRRCTN